MKPGDQTFMRITNKDIYQKLIKIEEHVKATNGKVKLNTWRSVASLTLGMTILGFLVDHIIRG